MKNFYRSHLVNYDYTYFKWCMSMLTFVEILIPNFFPLCCRSSVFSCGFVAHILAASPNAPTRKGLFSVTSWSGKEMQWSLLKHDCGFQKGNCHYWSWCMRATQTAMSQTSLIHEKNFGLLELARVVYRPNAKPAFPFTSGRGIC